MEVSLHTLSCIFITEERPITPAGIGGGSALVFSHLELLNKAGIQVTLVLLATESSSKVFDDFIHTQPLVWQQVQEWCIAQHRILFEPLSIKNAPTQFMLKVWRDFSYLYLIANKTSYLNWQMLVSETSPDFVWSEYLLCTTFVKQATPNLKVIYSHSDWLWKIKSRRTINQNWKTQLKYWFRKQHEERLVRKVTACVSASATEENEIKDLGVHHVSYFPITYQPILHQGEQAIASPPRIVHLGGMQTTANRLGLVRFLDVSWPIICEKLESVPELWIVGSLAGAPDALLVALQQVGAICPGYVKDLSDVLRPYDLHIIPWEYNTGTRARVPLILNYMQVLVSTRAATACLPEVRHDDNSVLVDDLVDMAMEIVSLVTDKERRKRLALAGRQTFLTHFTQDVLQPRFNEFIKQLIYPQAILGKEHNDEL